MTAKVHAELSVLAETRTPVYPHPDTFSLTHITQAVQVVVLKRRLSPVLTRAAQAHTGSRGHTRLTDFAPPSNLCGSAVLAVAVMLKRRQPASTRPEALSLPKAS